MEFRDDGRYRNERYRRGDDEGGMNLTGPGAKCRVRHMRLAMMRRLRLFGVKHEAVGGPSCESGVEDNYNEGQRTRSALHG